MLKWCSSTAIKATAVTMATPINCKHSPSHWDATRAEREKPTDLYQINTGSLELPVIQRFSLSFTTVGHWLNSLIGKKYFSFWFYDTQLNGSNNQPSLE